MSREALLKRIEVEQDRFKVGMSLVVIVTSGLIGLVLKSKHSVSDYVLSLGGLIIDFIFIFILYTLKVYLRVNALLSELEEKDV